LEFVIEPTYTYRRYVQNTYASSQKQPLPDSDSEFWSPDLDYEDVKLKIIEEEGYDYHDFNIFDDRAALLWRKPYVDGAVRELTSGDRRRSVEQIRRQVEALLLAAHNPNPSSSVSAQPSLRDRSAVSVDITLDTKEQALRDLRRNPERYE
jgi:hypothetical protein